jgi:hypothetical protein
MNLTKNFTLEEMTKSETALRHDIDNSPEQEISAMKLPWLRRFPARAGSLRQRGKGQ